MDENKGDDECFVEKIPTEEELFRDRPNLLQSIIKLYKYIFVNKPEEEPVDLPIQALNDTQPLDLDINKVLISSYEKIIQQKKYEKELPDRLHKIPIIIDFMFHYYISKDAFAPVYSFPKTLLKYKLLTSVIKKDTVVDDIFTNFYNDQFIKDVLVKSPPYHIRIECTAEEIIKNIKEQSTKFKVLLDYIIRL